MFRFFVAFLFYISFTRLGNLGLRGSRAAIDQQGCPKHRSTCSTSQVRVRREYGVLTPDEKLDFIRSLQCLQQSPSRLPPGAAPGASHRYDDFIATHINLTFHVHFDGIFLSWHREFIRLFEKALREECGFRGTLPYWDWPKYASNMSAAPMFDGSQYSLGGNGIYVASQERPVLGSYTFSAGSGGGPVQTGPFGNTTLSFPNIPPQLLWDGNGTLPTHALDYHPHPLRRNFNQEIMEYSTQAIVTKLINETQTIADFQKLMDGQRPALDVHSAGHLAVGPDLQDVFTSPSDPAFWLHHTMVDLVYTEWQAKDPRRRTYALAGTSTAFNHPPSPDVTCDFELNWGFLGRPKKVRELLNVDQAPYCYRYEYSPQPVGV